MPTGYSGKPLTQKLGIKQDQTLVLLNAPPNYKALLGTLPKGVSMTHELKGEADFIQFFAADKASLESKFPKLKASAKQDGAIWVSWRKGSAKSRTDLSDGVVREVGLKNGLVDVKICAVDETWSALKFVRRAKDRRRTPAQD